MAIINLYNKNVKKYAYNLVKHQMQKDRITGYDWKIRNENKYPFEDGTIYRAISLSSYYKLKDGKATVKLAFRVLKFYGVRHGIYCEHKQGLIE